MAKLLSGTRIYGTATVDTQLFVSGSNTASSTITGALQVVGGAGVGGNLYVGGTIYGTVTTANNISAGTAGQLVYQTGPGATSFVGPGTAGQILLSSGTSAPVYTNTASIHVGRATLADSVTLANAAVTSTNVSIANETSASSAQYITFVPISTGSSVLKVSATTGLTYIPTTNYFGIGISTPTAPLHVVGGGTSVMRFCGALTGTIGVLYSDATQIALSDYSISNAFIILSTSSAVSVTTGGTEAIRVDSSQYVGINTNRPNYRLDVRGQTYIGAASTAPQLILGDTTNSTTSTITTNNGDLIFSGNGTTEALRITSSKGIAFGGSTNYGTSGQLLQSAGNASPTWANASTLSVGTATNIAAGTAGQLHYQTGPGATGFVGPGTAGQILLSSGTNAPVYTNTSSIYVGRAALADLATVATTANTATNLSGGTAGSLHYQSATGTTAMLAIGTTGSILTSSGSAPQWTALSSLIANTATNIANGSTGQIPYQTGPGTTGFSANLSWNSGTNTLTTTGTVQATTVTSLVINRTGGISAASWTTTSPIFNSAAATLTDNSSAAAATLAARVAASLLAPTFNATNSITVTEAINLYVEAPQSSANVVMTNSWGIWNAGNSRVAGSEKIGTSLAVGSYNTNATIGNIIASGSIGIGKNNPGYTLDVAGSVMTSQGYSDVSGNNAALRLLSPGGASYANTGSPQTGAIKIRLPQGYSNTMLRFTVTVYTYDGLSFDITCGGYNYIGAYWVNTFAYMTTQSRGSLNVRFGYDGTYSVVYIGELATAWTYSQIFVTDFQAGYSNYGATQWNTGWAISYEASAFATVTATQAVYPQLTSNSTIVLSNSLTAGTGLSGTAFNGSAAVTWTNAGVTSNVAGAGISVSGATGAVTITNSGVTSIVAGTNISVSAATGAVTVNVSGTVANAANAVTATNATNVYQSTDPAAGTYRLLLGNGTNGYSAVYNKTALYWNDTTSIIQGANISGNSVTVGGFTPSQTGGTANRVVVADANGYIVNNYFNTTGGGSERNASGIGYFAGFNSSDYYIRSYTPAAVLSAIGALPLAGGTMTGAINATTINTSAGLTDTSGVNSALRVLSPGGASSWHGQSSVTGAIKIKLPTGLALSNTMLRFTVKVYTYDNLSFDITCGGYTYTGPSWINTFAYMTTQSRTSLNVRFGYDTSTANYCIYIGELATVWSYCNVFVTDFQAGFSSYSASSWNTGWAISYEASAFATVTSTQAVYPQVYNAGTWAINISGTAATATSCPNYLPLAGGPMTGLIAGKTNTGGGYTASNDTGSMSVRGDASNGAFISYHRPGVYAINMGLDTDNIFKIGGWSAGATYVGVSAGQLLATSEITAYYSDGRLKTNLGNITGALDAVTKLNGFRYTNNELAKTFGYTDEKVQLGVNAQEVEALFPEIVTIAPFDITTDPETGKIISKSGENYKTVRYEKLVPVLIEAIKEQQAAISAQAAQIEKLTKLVEKLIKE